LSYGFQIPIVALTAGIMIDEKENFLSQEWTTTYQSQLRYQIWKEY
jgi:hypothetical protein